MTGALRQVPLGALIGLIMFIQVQVPRCIPIAGINIGLRTAFGA